MRHGKKFNHLGRKAAHRKAMLANMACSLIEHKRIKTTLAKAKALRIYVEPLITKSKDDTTHSRRIVFSYLKQKEAITELFGDVAAKVAERPGGYTRILKLSNRLGDNAQMAYIELVDYNGEYTTDKPKRKKARRGKKQAVEAGISTVEEAVVVEEASVTEEAVEEPKAEETTEVATEEAVEEPKAEEVVEETLVVEGAVEEQVETKEETKEESDNSEEKKEKGE
ncbi:MAG TPA: 50S ribosomal protein L17 [Flavobacteriales bacterium]|nr:50S ribosomal protein L17 [Flavobacteriales bacterium]